MVALALLVLVAAPKYKKPVMTKLPFTVMVVAVVGNLTIPDTIVKVPLDTVRLFLTVRSFVQVRLVAPVDVRL